MEWHDIESALARLEPPFPRAAVEEARARWDEWAPHFVAVIERFANGGPIFQDEADEKYEGLFSLALYLAAEKRDARAFGPLVRACHCSPERADEMFGDDLGGTLGQLIASVCDGNLAPLKALAEDRDAAMWCRYAALHAMVVRVVEGDGNRDELLAYIETLCEREAEIMRRDEWDFERDPSDLLTWAADASCELAPEPLLEKIRGWMDEGLIDPTVTGLKWFEKKAAMSTADCLAEAAEDKNNRYIEDGLAMLEQWLCFDEFAPDEEHDALPRWQPDPVRHGDTFVRETPKVGRNDPCPCGSGKKFKKCCGKASDEPVAEDDDASAVDRALDWLMTRHRKSAKAAVEDMLTLGLNEKDEEVLRDLNAEDWQFIQINTSEWLIAEGEIWLKGKYRSAPDLLLGPGGPLVTAGQRRWIEQLASRPLRLYDITDALPGVQMTLCDALETDAAPVVVYEKSGSRGAQVGTQIGARLMLVGGHYEMSGAAYPFSRLASPGLMAELRSHIAECMRLGDDQRRVVSRVIRQHWLAQFIKPLPLPTFVDSYSGDLLLFITDHYRVKDWDALVRALGQEGDVEGDRQSGWSRSIDCEDGARRPTVTINLGKSADEIELFYKTQAYADKGRSWFDALAGDAVKFAGRVFSDPKGMMKHLPAGRKAEGVQVNSGLPVEAVAEAIEKALHRSYANWADEPIPALGDKTPRQAIETPAGQERVMGLLRSYEAGEKRMAAEQGRREISYAFLWEAVGMPRPAAQ